MNLIIGIDPGLSGGIAVIKDSGFTEVDPFPTQEITVNGKTRREYDRTALLAIITRYSIQGAKAFVERQWARKTDGVSSCFTTGKGYGEILMALTACMVPVEVPTPTTWRKGLSMGLSGPPRDLKLASLKKARDMFPQCAERIGKHDGMAEALLIAEYGRRVVK